MKVFVQLFCLTLDWNEKPIYGLIKSKEIKKKNRLRFLKPSLYLWIPIFGFHKKNISPKPRFVYVFISWKYPHTPQLVFIGR